MTEDELWYKEGTDPLIAALRERLALTEKALELACICVANKMPIEMKSVKWWVKYFIEKAGGNNEL
jgi:hypothetical protein